MRVLVTGGAGFIGSNLVLALSGAGHVPGVVDDLSSGSAANLQPAVWFRRSDVCGPDLGRLVEEFAPDAVVHLAAQVDVSASIADPEHDRLVNVEGTRSIAIAARDAGARRMIVASSAAVYGPDVEVPTPETALKAPFNPYGEHKLQAEAVLGDVFSEAGLDHAALRFANVYGPRQSALGEGGVVAIFTRKMLLGQTPTVYGDGLQTRDFIFVGDVCKAIVAAVGFEGSLAGDGPDGSAYNVSTGRQTTVEALGDLIIAATGTSTRPDRASERPGDVRHSALDPGKARSTLGWSATTDLRDGLEPTVRFFELALR